MKLVSCIEKYGSHRGTYFSCVLNDDDQTKIDELVELIDRCGMVAEVRSLMTYDWARSWLLSTIPKEESDGDNE